MSKNSNALRARSGLTLGGQPADMRALIDLASKDGTRFVEVAAQLCSEGKLRWEDVDMRALFAATIDVQCNYRAHIAGIGERTLTASAFPVLAGNLTAELLARQDESDTIWQDLVTVRDTNKETTHLVRIVNSDESHMGGRKPGIPYPTMTSAEERVQVDTVDDGRRVAIDAKAIETNDKPGFLEQVVALRQWANERRDRVTLQRVYDVYGSGTSPAAPYVYRPNGSGTALYTTSTTAHLRAPSGTRLNNTALVDGESIQAAINVLANMRNELGYRVSKVAGITLLVPQALRATLEKIIKSEMTPGNPNEFNPYGPRGSYQITMLSSPKIDDFTTSSWLACRRDFGHQFVMVARLNMEYVSMAASAQDFLRTRLAFEARVADEFEIGARDHNCVVQCLAASTAPTGATLGA